MMLAQIRAIRANRFPGKDRVEGSEGVVLEVSGVEKIDDCRMVEVKKKANRNVEICIYIIYICRCIYIFINV